MILQTGREDVQHTIADRGHWAIPRTDNSWTEKLIVLGGSVWEKDHNKAKRKIMEWQGQQTLDRFITRFPSIRTYNLF